MDVLAFDGRMGAAGDMIVAALLDAGADPAVLQPVEDALGVTYAVSTTERNGIEATAVDVRLEDGAGPHADGGVDYGTEPEEGGRRHEGDGPHDRGHDGDAGHHHGHEHDPDDHRDPGHQHPPRGHHPHAEGAGPHRTYGEVVDLVSGMSLPGPVEADALAVFERLGEAEAAVHGTDLDATHFHEVGADDAVADVVGAALLLADLDVDRVVATPLSAGGGEVEMSHGRYPVPTPAVVEIARHADWSLRGGPVDAELLTPTGAAILAHVAEGVEALPPLRVRRSGYGAGDRTFPEHPNVLRALVGDGGAGLEREAIRVLETTLDDVSPEVLGGLQETLAEAGALDVSVVPLTMKKSRPGHLVKVIVRPEDAERVARRLAEETGTLGVREGSATHRWVAARSVESVEVTVDGEAYAVDVKVATTADGDVYDVSAEYEDAAAVASETRLPVRTVLRRAEAAAREERP